MTQYAYSPHTGEHIVTDNPSDWMGLTDVAPPTYDRATAGCFWRGGAWEIVIATPEAPTPETIKSQISALESTQLRAVRESTLGYAGALARLQAIDDAIAELRKQL